MKNYLTYQTFNQTVLKNIWRLRKQKNMSSKEMAYSIGMKPPEYSKLENGKKQNFDIWISKIAVMLGVTEDELRMEELENTNKPSFIGIESSVILEKKKAEYIQLFKELDEKDNVIKLALEAKDALIKCNEEYILELKNISKYWQQKYNKIKSKLIEIENTSESRKKAKRIEKKDSGKSISSPGNIGGGVNSFVY